MKNFAKITAAVLTGALLSLSATTAFADGRGHDRGTATATKVAAGNTDITAITVARSSMRRLATMPRRRFYDGPPRVVYQPDYYVPRPAPAITIGLSPIVIPLR